MARSWTQVPKQTVLGYLKNGTSKTGQRKEIPQLSGAVRHVSCRADHEAGYNFVLVATNFFAARARVLHLYTTIEKISLINHTDSGHTLQHYIADKVYKNAKLRRWKSHTK
jgi:hypothetical protein